ncbi:MAG: hypothetical protein J6B62_09380, partial [Bacteroidales bacterium]|nr:hypothetical protein [Bacteroidales bacterium]
GQRLPSHLDNGVEVYNYARNGRSTKSFQTLGEWDKVKADLGKGTIFSYSSAITTQRRMTLSAVPPHSDFIRRISAFSLTMPCQ